ncbi:MAG: hypothetical protein ABS75_05050 [Pelagibacterium sp. SCN 63-23]|nr:MAG: hypothetical protein ABS75_05050 [Pelagibacterium sp. SCN 63-23]
MQAVMVRLVFMGPEIGRATARNQAQNKKEGGPRAAQMLWRQDSHRPVSRQDDACPTFLAQLPVTPNVHTRK